jgi:mRNA interferase MazF
MNNKYCRGDIYYADLGEGCGSEQSGRRPVIIVQNNIGNRFAPTLIVVPVTSREKPAMPTHLPLNHVKGIRQGSVALVEQLMTIDKSRIGKRIGALGYVATKLMDAALLKSLDLKSKPTEEPTLITLCATCFREFESNPDFNVRRTDYHQDIKDTCDYCQYRSGFDYWLTKK